MCMSYHNLRTYNFSISKTFPSHALSSHHGHWFSTATEEDQVQHHQFNLRARNLQIKTNTSQQHAPHDWLEAFSYEYSNVHFAELDRYIRRQMIGCIHHSRYIISTHTCHSNASRVCFCIWLITIQANPPPTPGTRFVFLCCSRIKSLRARCAFGACRVCSARGLI